MNITLVPVAHIDQVWPRIAGGIETSTKRCGSDITPSFLWRLCRSGEAWLFVAHDEIEIFAASIHRFEQYQDGMKLCCLALWGTGRKGWQKQMIETVKQTAKAGGANGLVSEGSEAFLRIVPEAKKVRTLFEVPI